MVVASRDGLKTRPADGDAACTGTRALRVEVARGSNGLKHVEDAWMTVAAKLPRQRFFHWYCWTRSWLEALAENADDVRFFLFRDGATPVAVIPLVRELRRHLHLSTYAWCLPSHEHIPLADIVCVPGLPPGDLFRALLPALAAEGGRWDLLELRPLLAESPLAGVAGRLPLPAQLRREKTCDQIDCSEGFETIRSRFSKNFRSNLNKARNKLKKQGELSVSSLSLQPKLQPAFEEFLELEASGWKGRDGAGTAIALHPELVRFYQSLIDLTRGNVVVNRLHVDGQLIAAQFCVRDRDTLYILKLAYDESRKRLAPGNMLLERVIRRGAEQGDWRYVNLVGNPPWFQAWAPESKDVCRFRLFNRTPAGRCLRAAYALRHRLASLKRRIDELRARS